MAEKNEKHVVYKVLEKSLIEKRAEIKEFTYSLDLFSRKATPNKPNDHRSYVYALCEKVGDSLIPFYIGEGKGPRVWAHELEASEQIKLLEEELNSDEEFTADERLERLEQKKLDLKEKIKKIDEIKRRKGEVVKYIIKWGMTSKEAFMAESALINLLQIGGLKFEYKENKLTNIVKGHQSEGEKQTGLTTARTVEEYCEEYAKEPLYLEELQKKRVKAILININAGYTECLKKPQEERSKAIKDTVCGNWKLSEKRLNDLGIEYVFATVQARVVGIYRIKEVNSKKYHIIYESVEKNSGYPHGDDTVPFRNTDYEFAENIVNVANSKRIPNSEIITKLELSDMPNDFRKAYIKRLKKENPEADPENEFKKSLKRKYMILEYLSKDDPNYKEYIEYLHRRIIHKDGSNIYGSNNPIRYIE